MSLDEPQPSNTHQYGLSVVAIEIESSSDRRIADRSRLQEVHLA